MYICTRFWFHAGIGFWTDLRTLNPRVLGTREGHVIVYASCDWRKKTASDTSFDSPKPRRVGFDFREAPCPQFPRPPTQRVATRIGY